MADISIKFKTDFEQAQNDFKELQNMSESTRKKIEKFAQSFKTDQIDKFSERNKLASIAVTATRGKLAGMITEAAGLRKEIERLIKKGMDPQNEELQKLTSNYQRLEREIGKASKKSKDAGMSFATLTKGIIGANIIERIFFGIGSGIKSIVDEARKLEDAEAAFTPLMGGAERAKELVRALNVAAAETPFQFEGIQKTVSTLLPVMNGDIQKTIDTFKMLGDTAGGNQQKLESVTRGFTKAMLKGKVDMESLNMIAEAGVPIFQEMAVSMGYGKDRMSDFFKAVSTGKVSTDELVKAFKKMTSEGGIFYQGMITASKTTSGVLSTLSDSIAMTAAGIGQAFLPYIKAAALAMIEFLSSILKWINTGTNLADTLETIGNILTVVGVTIGAYVIYVKAAAIATAIYTAAQAAAAAGTLTFAGAIKALTAAMALNPIGLIIAAVAALITIIILLVKNWDTVKIKIIAAVTAIKAAALMAWEHIKLGFLYAVKGIIYGLSLLYKPFILVIDKIIEAFNYVTGKNIPTLSKKIGDLSQGIDRQIAGVRGNIANLRSEQAKQQAAANKAAQEQTNITKKTNDEQAASHNQKNAAIKKGHREREKSFQDMLKRISMSEFAQSNERIKQAQDFWTKRAELEGETWEARIEFLKSQHARINEIEGLSAKQRKDAEIGLRKAIEAEQRKMFMARIEFAHGAIGATRDLIGSLQQIMKNAGKESKALAYTFRALSAAEAMISAYLAFNKTLASGGFWATPMAYIVLAAGIAKAIAIQTTPIPTAQTGLENFEIPDIPAMRNDRAAVMASPGETVSVTPRGEDGEKNIIVNIDINEENLFRIIQRGINIGKINLSDKNIRTGVFAT